MNRPVYILFFFSGHYAIPSCSRCSPLFFHKIPIMLKCHPLYKVVATSEVSLVSTGPLLPSLKACFGGSFNYFLFFCHEQVCRIMTKTETRKCLHSNASFTSVTVETKLLGLSNSSFKMAEKLIREHSNLLGMGCMGMEEGKGVCACARTSPTTL